MIKLAILTHNEAGQLDSNHRLILFQSTFRCFALKRFDYWGKHEKAYHLRQQVGPDAAGFFT